MSILIKGMEMPKNCEECPCFDEGFYYCNAKKENLSERLFDHTKDPPPNWCPLIEFPPHGKWLYTPTHWAYCSECGKEPPDECNITSDFCPNCGADMRGSEGEE